MVIRVYRELDFLSRLWRALIYVAIFNTEQLSTFFQGSAASIKELIICAFPKTRGKNARGDAKIFFICGWPY